ncbi:hypothetical protein HAZT_HAZT009314 [Hyalella azteca]|uniref:USP domain-containing protein n=1 Tax=Hyalella azteca TaxID=294128 RepID=A0A6A0H4H6_HYAAZ|nr:hypothetical protein HAZT_HAZT009314 [Hyalella azteca]
MNSVLQQLFLVPGVREDLLSITIRDNTETSLLYQLQTVFGHLLESELQFYEPRKFWESFRMDGQPVNIREQQDAFEFYTRLVEQVDECLKKRGIQRVFARRFEGLFSIQRLCQDCPHRFEREESFLSLNLTVKKLDALHSSLDQLVKGELLEGDNACYCDICRVKGRAVVRTCIKSAPQVLTIQLKRFGYDYDRGRSVKFDDHYEFPWLLDMAPYTAEYLAEVEDSVVKKLECDDNSPRSTTPSPEKELQPLAGRGSYAEAVAHKPDIIPVSIKEAVSGGSSGYGEDSSSSGMQDEDTEMISPDKVVGSLPPSPALTSSAKSSPLPIRRSSRKKNDTSEKHCKDSIPEGRQVPVNQDGRQDSGYEHRRRTRQEALSSSSSTESSDVFVSPTSRTPPPIDGDKIKDPSLSSSLPASACRVGPLATPPGAVALAASEGFATPTSSPRPVRNRKNRALLYDLVGVVVHSGQAAAGHYYSYIKDRRQVPAFSSIGDSLTNPNKGRWFKFNDTTVEAVEMTQAMLEHECFGGQYTAPTSSSSSLPEERNRYWSGYLLFYERREPRGSLAAPTRTTPATAPRIRQHSARSLKLTHGVRRALNLNVSPVVGRSRRTEEPQQVPATTPSPTTSNPPLVSSQSQCFDSASDVAQQVSREERNRERFARSSLSELRELMEEGEKRGIFSQQRLPPHILASIVHHNLELYRNRCIYVQPYYDFLAQLCGSLVLPSSTETQSFEPIPFVIEPAANSSSRTSDDPKRCQSSSLTKVKFSTDEQLAHSQATKLALSFLFNSYLRLKNKKRSVVEKWCQILSEIVQFSPAGCTAALEFFSEDSGHRHLRPLLLHSTHRGMRECCSTGLKCVLLEAGKHCNGDDTLMSALKTLIKTLLEMLRDAVPSAVQHSQHYFSVLLQFCSQGKRECNLVLKAGGFSLLMLFLLGKELSDDAGQRKTDCDELNTEDSTRRWTSVQAQEFGSVHAICAELIARCDLSCLATQSAPTNISMASVTADSPHDDHHDQSMTNVRQKINAERLVSERSESPVLMEVHHDVETSKMCDSDQKSPKSSSKTEYNQDSFMTDLASPNVTPVQNVQQHVYLDNFDGSFGITPTASILEVLSGNSVSIQWLSIVVTAYRELLEPMPKMTTVLMTACVNNRPFSTSLISTVLSQYSSAPSNMLRELSQLLLETLTISDQLHEERVVFLLEGGIDTQGSKCSGLLELINEYHTSDVRRAYQCMKLCVNISSRFTLARDVLSNTSSKWHWAVEWLKDTIHSALDSSSNFNVASAALSNEGSHTNVFQRTTSAQMTLEEATFLLSQMEPADILMDTENSNDGLGDIREDSPTPSNLSGSSVRWT